MTPASVGDTFNFTIEDVSHRPSCTPFRAFTVKQAFHKCNGARVHDREYNGGSGGF